MFGRAVNKPALLSQGFFEVSLLFIVQSISGRHCGESWIREVKIFGHQPKQFFSLFENSFLTHMFPVHPFATPWKHEKTVRFSDVFRG